MDYWEEMYEELKAYKEKHGNCNVSCSDPEYRKLGRWVMHQRENFKRKITSAKSCKTREMKIAKLKALGDFPFETNATEKTGWNDMFKQLKKFKEEHGHCNCTLTRYPNYKKLASWVAIQRTNVKRFHAGKQTTMNQHRIDRLKEIDFQFVHPKKQARNEAWKKKYAFARENDFLLGGDGGRLHIHRGNAKLRQIVEDNKVRYQESSLHNRSKIAMELIQAWRELDPPGRFLMKKKKEKGEGSGDGDGDGEGEGEGEGEEDDDDSEEEGTGENWYDVGDRKAAEKLMRMLRQEEEERRPPPPP